ncbi:kinase [Lecanosticta acicola]|uniref:Kinase, partial n=1 Tax=Lecanosticta acicola TaxID=111012 RepID=A0AAI8Z8T6_9PEZI|nr:kinase [Lecanosticta acicola]
MNDASASDSAGRISRLAYTPDQKSEIERWLEKWRTRGCPPSQAEIFALATLLSIDKDGVSTLVVSHFASTGASSARQVPTAPTNGSSSDSAGLEGPGFSPERDVADWAQARNSTSCKNTQSKLAPSNKQFKCPTEGCYYSTDKSKELIRHLETKWPQEFWYCILCRENGSKPFICQRGSKLIDHLCSGAHNYPRGNHYDNIRDRSKIEIPARFPSVCPFGNARGPCNKRFSSWAEFFEHYLEHVRGRVSDGPWDLRHRFQRRFDEDDDNDSGDGPSSGSGSYNKALPVTIQHHGTTSTERNGVHSQSHSSEYQGRHALFAGSDTASEHPVENKNGITLVDVVNVRVNRQHRSVKYLALEYSLLDTVRGETSNSYDQVQQTTVWDSRHDALQEVFLEAVLLTRRMGYRYLWIDTVCASSPKTTDALAALRGATLVIVLFGRATSPERIWHFTCHYSKVSTVMSWVQADEAGLSFAHIQNLGHGAFGIVDEVKLLPSHESFARKTWTASGNHESLANAIQEFEILERCRHPNIPSFVASYFQRQSLNVLTQPVAQCDLRVFLNDPHLWQSKRPHLPRWYYSLASALEHIHGQGYRHKDIKPANILLHEEDVYISDFGTSRHGDPESSGAGVFTPKYCAPEVASRKQCGRKADIFSLGCVFLEMVTVEHNIPLRNLEAHIRKSSRRGALRTYQEVIPRLLVWIDILEASVSSQYHCKILDIGRIMLSSDPDKRPSAATVCQTLSPLIANSMSKSLAPASGLPSPQLAAMHGQVEIVRWEDQFRQPSTPTFTRYFENAQTQLGKWVSLPFGLAYREFPPTHLHGIASPMTSLAIGKSAEGRLERFKKSFHVVYHLKRLRLASKNEKARTRSLERFESMDLGNDSSLHPKGDIKSYGFANTMEPGILPALTGHLKDRPTHCIPDPEALFDSIMRQERPEDRQDLKKTLEIVFYIASVIVHDTFGPYQSGSGHSNWSSSLGPEKSSNVSHKSVRGAYSDHDSILAEDKQDGIDGSIPDPTCYECTSDKTGDLIKDIIHIDLEFANVNMALKDENGRGPSESMCRDYWHNVFADKSHISHGKESVEDENPWHFHDKDYDETEIYGMSERLQGWQKPSCGYDIWSLGCVMTEAASWIVGNADHSHDRLEYGPRPVLVKKPRSREPPVDTDLNHKKASRDNKIKTGFSSFA